MLAKLLIVPIVLAIGFLGWQVVSKQTISPQTSSYSSPTPVAATQTFTASSVMNSFTVQIPQGFNAEEKFATIFVKNQTGEIRIRQNTTNFMSLEEYIKNSRNNLNTILEKRASKEINGLTSISGFVEKEKIYFIYSNQKVYIISTDRIELYDFLDQIAQSFTLRK